MQLPPMDEQGRFLPSLRTASLFARGFAKLLDLFVAALLTLVASLLLPSPWAPVVGSGWLMLTDWAGSPGKWLLQIRAVTLEGAPLGPLAALARNVAFGLPALSQALLATGWVGLQGEAAKWDAAIGVCVGLTMLLGELIGLVMQPDNRRWGDTFARTRVVDR